MRVTMKAAITNAGLSQAKVAELMGVHINTMSEWCRGRTYPNIKQLERFCEIVSTPDNQVEVWDIFFK